MDRYNRTLPQDIKKKFATALAQGLFDTKKLRNDLGLNNVNALNQIAESGKVDRTQFLYITSAVNGLSKSKPSDP